MIDSLDLDVAVEAIKNRYGIDLLWNEKWFLSLYVELFMDKHQNKEDLPLDYYVYRVTDPFLEAQFQFMKDYFGLDFQELYRRDTHSVGRRDFTDFFRKRPFSSDIIGADMIGTPEFKEYCIRHVDEWRYDRDML